MERCRRVAKVQWPLRDTDDGAYRGRREFELVYKGKRRNF
jgi:hypothetical protein